MGKGIHMRIFFPVMILLILFPVLSWLAFWGTSDWYIRYIVRKDVDRMMERILDEADLLYQSDGPEELERKEERQKARQLLEQIKGLMKRQDTGANLLVLNSKKNIIYPSREMENDSRQSVFDACRTLLDSENYSPGITFCSAIGQAEYMINIYEVESANNIRAKYYVGYAPVPETKLLLSRTGTLMLVIAVCLSAAAAAILWVTAGGIARPLKKLCIQANMIGRGNYSTIMETYSVSEAEELKEAFNRMAERLKDAKEQNTRFFQNVSHDLRTPLVSISGYAQGIQCGVFEDDKRAAGIILTESLRMKELVESILAISKMDNHEFILHRVQICLEELLEEQTQIMMGSAKGKELVLSLNNESVTIDSDPQLLIRMFQNIVTNCIRYAAHTVKIRLYREEEWAVISIEDDGSGIPQEEVPYIFERFFKGENGNFGIGLSIVRAGAEYMGGAVTAENKAAPDHGAIFKLRLPLQIPKGEND